MAANLKVYRKSWAPVLFIIVVCIKRECPLALAQDDFFLRKKVLQGNVVNGAQIAAVSKA